MPDWTNSAKEELERYSQRVEASLAGSEADSAEVIEDIKRHIESDVVAANLKIVTEQDVRRIVTRFGEPDRPGLEKIIPSSGGDDADAKSNSRPGITLLLFGVILPMATFIIELVTRMCATSIIDPMPTLWHELLVGFVPLSNLAIWVGSRNQNSGWRRSFGIANGFAIGICFYYSLMFLPMAMPGLFGIIFFGFGLLPLTPFIALGASLRFHQHLKRMPINAGCIGSTGSWLGLTVATVIILVLALPVPVTRYFEQMAVSDSKEEATQGVKFLRKFGANETLLKDCYGNGYRELEFSWLEGKPVAAEKARNIFFRVTGKPFNSVSPTELGHSSRNELFYNDWSWDFALGGETVEGFLKGLSLHSSRVDARVEPDAALAYYEWTLEFKNDASVEREARAQVLLPSGGLVSRLTLWINGQEREAAFGGRSQVRTAYQEVAVQQRHDPVLVTTCGPDRILMQCFPVPPNGGTMKVRIGISVPLTLEDNQSGKLRWPVFLERNFGVATEFKHSVWMQSKQPMKSGLNKLKLDQPQTGQFNLRGELTDADLNNPEATVSVRRNSELQEMFAAREGSDQLVRQRIIETHEQAPSRVVLVVDGSVGLAEAVPSIVAAMRHLPEGGDFAMVLASDTNTLLSASVQKGSRSVYDTVSKKLENSSMVGGQDNVPALIQAWDIAAETNHATVVWIHGPQPLVFEGVDGLRQRFERSPDGPKLIEIQTKIGPNRVAEQLDGLAAVRSVPRSGRLEDDLNHLFDRWNSDSATFALKRELVDAKMAATAIVNAQIGSHVVRLWAAEEVMRLASQRHFTQAAELAAGSHIVTPYSGAVVLETAAQYARNGLTPDDPEKVPTMTSVPDGTGTFWLFLLVLLLLFSPSYFRKINLNASKH